LDKPPLRRTLIPVTVLVAIAVAYGQMALNIGMSPAEFSAEGDAILRAASFAFSIWG
jgi:hypothetical protein